MSENPTRFRLAEVLSELGWTQKELAIKAGLSRQTISKLVHDPTGIRFDTLNAISKATGKQVSELLVEDE